MTCNVTLTVNLEDSVLGLAQDFHGTSRAGRPDLEELSLEETRWLIEASRHTVFDIIDVGNSEIPGFPSGSHGFWYQHPWVSSDVLVQFPLSRQAGGAWPGQVPDREGCHHPGISPRTTRSGWCSESSIS